MKRLYIFLGALITAVSCMPQEEIGDYSNLAGMWAEVGEGGWTGAYILFEDGCCSRYVSEKRFYVAENTIWNSSEEDFASVSKDRYSICDGMLNLGYPLSASSQRIQIGDDGMTLDDVRYCSFKCFDENMYSTIVLPEECNTSFGHEMQNIEWECEIVNPVKGYSLTAATAATWIHNLRVEDGKVRFTVRNQDEDVEGKILLSYPTADDLEVPVQQTGTREIVLPYGKTVLDYPHVAKRVSIYYSIRNPKNQGVLTAVENVSWISNLEVESDVISFDISEYFMQGTRSGKITLSYPDAQDVELTIRQNYEESRIIFYPRSKDHDCNGRYYSFTCHINNPHTGMKMSATSEASWIEEVSVSDYQVSYFVSMNDTGAARTGKIRLEYGGAIDYFEVIQACAPAPVIVAEEYPDTYPAHKMEQVSIGCTIENKRSGEELTAETDSPFITNLRVVDNVSKYTIYFDLSENLTFNREGIIILKYREVVKELLINQLCDGVNLSEAGTANSYIVSSAGTYKFKTVQGNSDSSVGTVNSSAVLWESFGTSETPAVGDLVRNISCSSDGYIRFETPETFREGNAVIAAKDSDGKILWSWHIWLTDRPQEHVYPNDAGIMMDRNLGATSANPGDGCLTYGLLYQWGRKDPFLGSLGKSTILWPSAVETSSSVGTVDYVTSHPTTFVIASSSPSDWHYSSSRDNTLWTTSESAKSIYDPCPADWRVPDGDIWSKAGFDDATYDSINKGTSFNISSPSTTWYPAAGYRGHDGTPTAYGWDGFYWTASPMDNFACYLYLHSFDLATVQVFPSARTDRAFGHSVRCQKE